MTEPLDIEPAQPFSSRVAVRDQRRRASWMVIAMAGTFAVARAWLHWRPDTDLNIGGYNVHHLFTGVLILAATILGRFQALFEHRRFPTPAEVLAVHRDDPDFVGDAEHAQDDLPHLFHHLGTRDRKRLWRGWDLC